MENWEDLSGKNKWEGLLEPLNDDLRCHLIHYGEMAEATYNAYDKGNGCKYHEHNLFSEVGLAKGRAQKKYEITRFIYATASYLPFKKDTNWIGYVAVATDEGKKALGRRDIVVVWRGTVEGSEWRNNMLILLGYPSRIFDNHGLLSSYVLSRFNPSSFPDYSDLKVHMGFYKVYTKKNKKSPSCKMSASEQVREEVSRLLELYKNDTISLTMTGHSLGGALAILSAIDIEINVVSNWNNSGPGPRPRPRVTVFLFGCPQVGNSRLRDFVESLNTNLHILRIENKPDIVPRLPWVGDISDIDINRIQKSIIISERNRSHENNLPDIRHDQLARLVIACAALAHKYTHHYKDVGQELLMDTDRSYHLKEEKGNIETIIIAHNMEVYLHGISGTQGVANPFKEKVERDITLINKHGYYLDHKRHKVPGNWWNKPDKANMVQKEDGSWEHCSV